MNKIQCKNFKVSFSDETQLLSDAVMAITLPTFAENSKIEIQFEDRFKPSTQKILKELYEKIVKNPNSVTCTIEMFDDNKEIRQSWVLNIEHIDALHFGYLDFGSNDKNACFLTFTTNNCDLK